MKLLNIDANPKTVKGQKHGYMTAVLYLSPYTLSGKNLCPTAEAAGCWRTCLNTAGRGGIPSSPLPLHVPGARVPIPNLPNNAIQRARLARTAFWHQDRPAFMVQLCEEIEAFVHKAERVRKAERKGLTPCVRLNGTSDIPWERVGLWPYTENTAAGYTIFDRFPRVQFYDYTKLPVRLGHLDHAPTLPANYRLSISWSGADSAYRDKAESWARQTGAPLVVVCDRETYATAVAANFMRHDYRLAPQLRAIAERAGCTSFVNGDEHDLRFADPPHSLVVLKAKGTAKRETNGFVLRAASC